jgi:hypothetical protein
VSTRLNDLIECARAVGVRADHARDYVAGLPSLAATPASPRRAWAPWLVGAFGLAAAAVMLVLLLRGSDDGGNIAAITVGDRVAIIADPATTYRIARTTATETIVEVDRGTITARLWSGEVGHRLVLRGGSIDAVATGTVYSLTVDDRGEASVAVHEGKVSVENAGPGTRAIVEPGARWPDTAPARGAASARRLLAAARPAARDVVQTHLDAGVVDASVQPEQEDAVAAAIPSDASARVPVDAMTPADAMLEAPPDALPVAPSLNERWRRARLLRGQGNYDAAIKECLAIADANDRTWSPIALVEAIRIELGPLTSPERALVLADRFARTWASHDLAPEARELRCRALRQLGREPECTTK